jgi:hypothetical protein
MPSGGQLGFNVIAARHRADTLLINEEVEVGFEKAVFVTAVGLMYARTLNAICAE